LDLETSNLLNSLKKLIRAGWNPENGYPLKETLKDLDLDFVTKDLYKNKKLNFLKSKI